MPHAPILEAGTVITMKSKKDNETGGKGQRTAIVEMIDNAPWGAVYATTRTVKDVAKQGAAETEETAGADKQDYRSAWREIQLERFGRLLVKETCTKCKQSKTLAEFYKHNGNDPDANRVSWTPKDNGWESLCFRIDDPCAWAANLIIVSAKN